MILSQAKMQKIQPKIKKIQEEFKGDQARIGQEMLGLYKKEKVNPAGSCLPLLIQMPILIGLYWVISGIGDPINHYHLYEFLKWFNLEHINSIFFGMDLRGIGGQIGMVFAVLLALVQWVQAKLSFSYNPAPQKQPKVIEPKKNGEYE
jgi:YidC/Oxa1 family membrane protein insertase